MQDSASHQLQRAQIRLVFEHMANGLRISLVVSLILVALVWTSVPTHLVVGWEVLLLLALGWRLLLSRRFAALGDGWDNAEFPVTEWRQRLSLSIFLTGLCWGAAGAVFQFYIDSPPVASLLVLSLLAMTVTAIPFLSHILSAYRAYLYTIIIPTGLSLAYLRAEVAIEITALMVVYLWGITHATRLFKNFIENSLRLQWQKEKLSQDLAKSKQQLDEFFNNAPLQMYLKDSEGRYLRVNRQFEKLFGVRERHVQGKLPVDLHHPALAKSARRHDLDVINTGRTIHRTETAILDSEGKPHEFLTVKFPLIDDQGDVYGLGVVATDITQEQEAKSKIEHLANYDALTDLPNRRLLLERLNRCLAYDRRYRHQGALLFLDLDNFKTINDSLGHSVGDLLLQDVARRLLNNLRSEDTVTRIGGDEFVILLPEIEGHTYLEHTYYTAEKLRKALEAPFYLTDQVLYITCSIGISLFPPGGKTSADDLLKQADSAMYSAKNAGRNICRFFSTEMQHEADARLKLHNDLRSALTQNKLHLHYQPQLNSSGQIVGAEALLRWKHPQSGEISPAVFIPVTEESGLILAIGEWVLQAACEQLQRWSSDETLAALPYLAVNISPKQFHHPEFVLQVENILSQTGVRPEQLALELTEGVEIENLEMVMNKMQALKSLGVRLIIDDFGIGYSSLTYLKHLPLDAIKIDKSFIREIHSDPHDAAIVEAILGLARKLKLKAIAEGVETRQQLAVLETMACTTYQGYYFSRPLPAAAFEEYVASTRAQRSNA